MLTSLLGIRLILWMGKTVPLPPPAAVVDAVTRVEVSNDASQGDGFQITFSLGKDAPAEYGLLQGGSVDLFNRVVIGVLMGAAPEVLIDGIITHHQVSPSNDPGRSTLTVTGRDVSVMMDLEEKNQAYENQPDFVIFSRLIAGYAQYGLVPAPTPTADVPLMLQRIPRQAETDLRFVQRLAQRNGYIFYVEPVTLGVNTAYFGPEVRAGIPQPALSINMGPDTNVTSLQFSGDGLAPVGARGAILEPITRTVIPLPSLPSLRVPPLAARPLPARRTTLLRDAAQKNPAQAATGIVASATNAPDGITGQGEVDALRYGAVLRARRLVGVRGAGLSYNGLYYVRRVTHALERGKYSQSFQLSREGTSSLLPVVPP